jgi:hypothetical protein
LQNPLPGGFSNWHLGHIISLASFAWLAQEYQLLGK